LFAKSHEVSLVLHDEFENSANIDRLKHALTLTPYIPIDQDLNAKMKKYAEDDIKFVIFDLAAQSKDDDANKSLSHA